MSDPYSVREHVEYVDERLKSLEERLARVEGKVFRASGGLDTAPMRESERCACGQSKARGLILCHNCWQAFKSSGLDMAEFLDGVTTTTSKAQ